MKIYKLITALSLLATFNTQANALTLNDDVGFSVSDSIPSGILDKYLNNKFGKDAIYEGSKEGVYRFYTELQGEYTCSKFGSETIDAKFVIYGNRIIFSSDYLFTYKDVGKFRSSGQWVNGTILGFSGVNPYGRNVIDPIEYELFFDYKSLLLSYASKSESGDSTFYRADNFMCSKVNK